MTMLRRLEFAGSILAACFAYSLGWDLIASILAGMAGACLWDWHIVSPRERPEDRRYSQWVDDQYSRNGQVEDEKPLPW